MWIFCGYLHNYPQKSKIVKIFFGWMWRDGRAGIYRKKRKYWPGLNANLIQLKKRPINSVAFLHMALASWGSIASETEIHPLCGWRQNVIQKNTFPIRWSCSGSAQTYKERCFYGNQGSEFSAHKMAVQVSYRFCSKIQKEDNIFATTWKYTRNIARFVQI